jgi:hypothetical protein
LSSNEGEVLPEVLKLSFEVSECKPLIAGLAIGIIVGLALLILMSCACCSCWQGLTLVHFSAQLEPFSSLRPLLSST